MKRIMLAVLALLIIASLSFAQEWQPEHGRAIDGKITKSFGVQWYKKIITGSDSTFAAGDTSAALIGASDTLISCYYKNKGNLTVQFSVVGATTNAIIIEVQGANSGDYAASVLPTSYFQTMYWISDGTGAAGNTISTSIDSVTTVGWMSTPIPIPLLGAEFFRFYIRTGVSESGNPVISARVHGKEE